MTAALHKGLHVAGIAFMYGLCAAAFLVPVGAVALVVRWLW